MEPEEDKKKLNDDMVVFMRKRSETDAPRYTAKLKTYVDFQQKRRRAAAARRHSEHLHFGKRSPTKKTTEGDQRDKSGDNSEQREDRKRGVADKGFHGQQSPSRSHSNEPADRCRRRRRRCCRRRRRRRSRRRRRRRRSRCRRRRSRRRRRRSCSRRRRRRSCRRRRRRCR